MLTNACVSIKELLLKKLTLLKIFNENTISLI